MTKLLRLILSFVALFITIVSKADNIANYIQKFDLPFLPLNTIF